MTSPDETPRTELSGSGALATSGGVAAGEGGVAISGDVLGNVIKAAIVINIIGGLEESGQGILRDLGRQIEKSLVARQIDPEELLRLIRLPVEGRLGAERSVDLLDYLQTAGETFGVLAERYDRGGDTPVFPFGEFLNEMISLMAKSNVLAEACFGAFGVEGEAVRCQDLGVMFGTRLRYRVLRLPEVEKALEGDLAQCLPHRAPVSLYRRGEVWSERALFLGQFYQDRYTQVVCPIEFRGRNLLAHQWQQPIEYTLFAALACGLLADFILYMHKLHAEQSGAQRFLDMLRRLRSQE